MRSCRESTTVASLLKRWLLGTHQGGIQHRHLDYYLDEFTFRFNPRRSRARGLLFHRLAQQAVVVGPIPYRIIIGAADSDRQTPETGVKGIPSLTHFMGLPALRVGALRSAMHQHRASIAQRFTGRFTGPSGGRVSPTEGRVLGPAHVVAGRLWCGAPPSAQDEGRSPRLASGTQDPVKWVNISDHWSLLSGKIEKELVCGLWRWVSIGWFDELVDIAEVE